MNYKDLPCRIDFFLLELTKKFAGLVQRTLGINNFDIALYLCDLSVLVSLAHLALCFLGENYVSVLDKFLSFSNLLMSIFLFPCLIRTSRAQCKLGFANPDRISETIASLRKVFTVLTCLFIFGFAYRGIRFLSGESVNWISLFDEIRYVLIYLMMYFSSVEPDPPCESRWRKAVRTLKSRFGLRRTVPAT